MEILKKYLVVIVILQYILMSCVKEANLKLPAPEEKLVVVCFINPTDKEVVASVKTSESQFGQQDTTFSPNFDNVKNATVVLSDGLISTELKYDANFEFYIAKLSSFKIEAGKTYYLVVKTPDGKMVDASTKVPSNKLIVQSYDVSVKKVDSIYETNTKLLVNDLPNETNYVAVYPQSLIMDNFFSDSTEVREDTITSNFWMSYFESDFNSSKANYSFEYTLQVAANKQSNIGIKTYVLNCSLDFYQYNKSLVNAVNSGFGNPFSQPALVYSNINNGFGCFAAYNPTIVFRRLN